MNNSEISKKVNEILCEEVLHYQINVSGDEFYLENYGIDSMAYLYFLYSIEKVFSIEIDDEDWKYNNFRTLDSLVDYIANRRK